MGKSFFNSVIICILLNILNMKHIDMDNDEKHAVKESLVEALIGVTFLFILIFMSC